jgi:tryptophan halogenase
MSNKINKIVIVGGGSSGWMTAATLIKAFPDKDITVVESPDVPIVGVGESTLGGIRQWTDYIGLKEEDFFKETDASYKMSIKFTDFYRKDAGGFHYPFGEPWLEGWNFGFGDWFIKKYFNKNLPITDFVDTLFPASYLFNQNKFNENIKGEFDNFNPNRNVAYHFDAVKFGIHLREYYCKPKGVKHIQALVTETPTNENGIESLVLDNGDTIYADLYVDCTGFSSILLSKALKEPFTSFNDLIPNDSAIATHLPYKEKEKEMEPFTNSTALGNGWAWNIPLWSRIGTGYVYSSNHISRENAVEEFKQYLMSDKVVVPRTREEVDSLTFKDIKMRVGIHERTFVKNVVAIGLSAGFIEPLESNGLFTVHEFLFKLVDALSRDRISNWDRDSYNISTYVLFRGFCEFVSLHYALSHRDDTQYWLDVQNKDYMQYMSKDFIEQVKGFKEMSSRYMELWSHPIGMAGITYISTGMNVNMINDHRMLSLMTSEGIDYEKTLEQSQAVWDFNINKWKENARRSPSLYQYLKTRFYDKSDTIDEGDDNGLII